MGRGSSQTLTATSNPLYDHSPRQQHQRRRQSQSSSEAKNLRLAQAIAGSLNYSSDLDRNFVANRAGNPNTQAALQDILKSDDYQQLSPETQAEFFASLFAGPASSHENTFLELEQRFRDFLKLV